MEYTFNFYDFASYIIPGGLTLSIFFWGIYDIFGVNIFPHIESLSSAIIILIGSYGLGYIILPIGSCIDHIIVKKTGGYYSYFVMQPDNDVYSDDYKKLIKNQSERLFNLKWDEGDRIEKKKKYKELFFLCYYYATNKAKNQYIDIFNGIHGLFRNLISVGIIGLLVSLLILFRNLIHFYFPCFPGDSWSYSTPMASLNLIVSIYLVCSSYGQLKRFGNHFVDAIYRNFCIYSQKEFQGTDSTEGE